MQLKKAEKLSENKNYVVHVVEDGKGGAWVHQHLLYVQENNF